MVVLVVQLWHRVWSFEELQMRYQNLGDIAKAELDGLLSDPGILQELMTDEIYHNGLFDGFTPPFVKNGVSDARVRHLKEKALKQQ